MIADGWQFYRCQSVKSALLSRVSPKCYLVFLARCAACFCATTSLKSLTWIHPYIYCENKAMSGFCTVPFAYSDQLYQGAKNVLPLDNSILFFYALLHNLYSVFPFGRAPGLDWHTNKIGPGILAQTDLQAEMKQQILSHVVCLLRCENNGYNWSIIKTDSYTICIQTLLLIIPGYHIALPLISMGSVLPSILEMDPWAAPSKNCGGKKQKKLIKQQHIGPKGCRPTKHLPHGQSSPGKHHKNKNKLYS